MIIAVDFDGTCVVDEFPETGRNIGAAPVLKFLQSQGHSIMLWSMRGNTNVTWSGEVFEKSFLQRVHEWEEQNRFKFDSYNTCPYQQCNVWTDSPKQFADIYLDDRALGAPLISIRYKQAVVKVFNWLEVLDLLVKGNCPDSTFEYLQSLVAVELNNTMKYYGNL